MSPSFRSSLALLGVLISCQADPAARPMDRSQVRSVQEIPVPAQARRVAVDSISFSQWLRERRLRADGIVRYFDGRKKPDQSGCYAVLDMTTGTTDLQQCADAIIRLRAEFLFARREYAAMSFQSTSGQPLRFSDWCHGIRYRLKGQKLEAYPTGREVAPDSAQLESWLQFVFTYAGTYSLQQQLHRKTDTQALRPGDVIVEGGFPGHAMLVMDVCRDQKGKEYFLLAQSYMPAQDMHVVINPQSSSRSPWFERVAAGLETPDWDFRRSIFYTW